MQTAIGQTQAVLVTVGVAALLLGLVGAQLLARRVTGPVERLAEGARELAEGRVGLQLDIRTGDELEALAAAFNHMSAELAAKQEALVRNLALVESLRRYQEDILRSMDEGLLTVDPDGCLVTVNRVGAALLALAPDQIEARPSIDLLFGRETPLVRLIRAGLDRAQMVQHAEIEWQREGVACPLGVSTASLKDAEGRQQGLLVLFRDLTQLKALEAQKRRADKLAALGTMSAGLAHEIKNPLAAIKTFVQLVPRKFDSDAFRERFNVTVPRELDRVNGIVESLLELARTPRLVFAPTDVNELIRRILALHGEQIEERRIVLDTRLDASLPPVRGDAEHLVRVFSNLVVNAVQAMPDGGRLVVTTQRGAAAAPGLTPPVAITIADTGVGMDEETVRKLFTAFFTTKAKGTGLGLALAQKIVEEHGGGIAVRSTPGSGSLFVVTLPAVEPG
jgi:two-component system sensor histidine kinase AtoS